MENDIPDAARVSVELANDAGNYGEMIDINRLHYGRLKLCCLQGIEHLQPFHDAVKLIGPTGLPVLHRLENMQHGRTPGGKFTRDPFPSSTPGARKVSDSSEPY